MGGGSPALLCFVAGMRCMTMWGMALRGHVYEGHGTTASSFSFSITLIRRIEFTNPFRAGRKFWKCRSGEEFVSYASHARAKIMPIRALVHAL